MMTKSLTNPSTFSHKCNVLEVKRCDLIEVKPRNNKSKAALILQDLKAGAVMFLKPGLMTLSLSIAVSTMSLLTLTGCGKTSTSTQTTTPQTSTTGTGTTTTDGSTTDSGSTTDTTTDGSGTTGSSTTSESVLPAITESFTVSGSSGTSPSYTTTVNTDNLLKIKVTAGGAGQITDPNYGFSGTYGCVSYKVTVLGSTQTTKLLAVGSQSDMLSAINCPGASTSQVLDFSGRLTSGHGSITVKVEAAAYDFYCRGCETYPWLYNAYPYGAYSCSLYCPSRPVYQTHTVTGNLDIQVNGTSL